MNTKKLFVLSVLAAGALIAMVPALADDREAAEGEEKRFHIHGEVRARLEYIENYFDFNDDTDDSFAFWPYRVRIAADGQLADNVRGYVELQNSSFFGDEFPDKGSSSSGVIPVDQVFQNTIDSNEVQLYQGWLELQKIGGSNISARIGRQEHTYGTELLMGDNDFYSGLSFDGLRGWWSNDRAEVNLFYYKVQENHLLLADATSVDQNFWGGTLDWKIGDNGGTVGAYLTRYQQLDFNTAWWDVGGRYARMPSKEQAFDWNAELVWQSGKDNSGVPELDIKGYAFEGWFGYSWGGGARQRAHIGALITTGDNNPADTDLETFRPLFGDIYAYNRLGNTDLFTLGDITDWNIGYEISTANEKHWFGAALHKFMTTEDVVIGPGVTENDLGTEYDLWYGYKFANNTNLSVGVANLTPGDLFPPPTDDDVLRVYGQAKVRW